MSVSPELCLRGVLDTLQNRITPALTDSYVVEVSRLAGLVLAIATNGIDDAAAIRIEENGCLRTLFGEAAGVVADATLAGKLQAAAAAESTGYKLSELDADNAGLHALLVDLHVAVEDQPGEAARALDSRIWRMLKQFEAARAPRR